MDFIARAGAMIDRAHRVAGFFLIACAVLAMVVFMQARENSSLASELRRVSAEMPVYVVPGSPVGIYTPTGPEMLLTNFAEFVVQNLNTYTYANLQKQYEELQRFLTPAMLTYANEYYQNRIAVVRQDEHSALFITERGTLRIEPVASPQGAERGTYYKVSISGQRHNILGGTVVATQPLRVSLIMRQASVSKTNPWGFMLAGYEEEQVPQR